MRSNRKNISIEEADEILYEMMWDCDEFELRIPNDDTIKILVADRYIYIKELNVNIHSGTVSYYDLETKEMETDYSLYIFFDSTTGEMIYYDAGSCLVVSISNYYKTLSLKYIYNQMKCDVCIMQNAEYIV